jgi:hypothetical protein
MPRKATLTADEIDYYLKLVATLPMPRDGAEQLANRLRPWAEADDGKPTYMLNLNRYFAELRPFPGAPEVRATPVEAHGHYHRRLTGKWLRNASYPIFTGTPQCEPLTQAQPGQECWDNVWIVRYPSRRKFLELLTWPGYADAEPYKSMALEHDLVPLAGGTTIPDFRWLAGGFLLAAFLAAGWVRAAWRGRSLAWRTSGLGSESQ